ncbi:Polysaccharide lyase [Arachidicoccus rhizosphaerae]|uniref:Polysaccharide lyase n=2 Tax=Arachidicoccus rhizosphaerae TaxID=551991 RepID=A0A1H4AF96_9BACT|nr:Polysaccharide lyase [Arachidicoccus rhizosphaerae]
MVLEFLFKKLSMLKWLLLLVLFIPGYNAVNGQVSNFRLYDAGSGIQAATDQSVVYSRFVPFNGRPSICFTLQKTDPTVENGKRAEVFFRAEKSVPVERWYAFNIWLPASFVADSLPEIVAQWHATPDFSLGEDYRSPPIALEIQNGKYQLATRWATQAVNDNDNVTGKSSVNFGNVENGKWTQWIFHIIFSYKNDGLIEVWKDGSKFYTKAGPNYYNDQTGPYFKFGIYKWDWLKTDISTTVNKRILYFSDIKFGDNNAKIGDFLNNN